MGSMDNLAHKMLHTFEKMDPINPTFEVFWFVRLFTWMGVVGEFDLRQNFGYLFGVIWTICQRSEYPS